MAGDNGNMGSILQYRNNVLDKKCIIKFKIHRYYYFCHEDDKKTKKYSKDTQYFDNCFCFLVSCSGVLSGDECSRVGG